MNKSQPVRIALFNCCLIAVLLAACGPATTSAPASSPSMAQSKSRTPGGRVVIRLLVDSYGREPDPAFVAAFNASQDDIQLELMYEVFEADWLRTQLARRADGRGGDLPDLIGPYSPGMLYRITDQWLDLNPYLDEDELAVFDLNALRGWQDEDGRLLGLPFKLFPSVIFYNRALFDAAGLPYPPHGLGEPYADGEAWTIEKMESLAAQLTLDGQGRTSANPDFDPADVKQYGLSHMTNCTGEITVLFGNLQLSMAADGKILLTDPAKEAIRWFYSGIWEKHFIPPGDSLERWALFDSGKAAMVYAPIWYVYAIETQQTWDLAPVPSYGGEIHTYAGMDGLAVLSTTRHPREAAQVLLYLASLPELFPSDDFNLGIGLPARPDFHPNYLAELDARYPQGVDGQVTVDSLAYSQYTYYDHFKHALCQHELMERLSETPGLDLEAEFDR
jgi:multiple sugar transport system substrate-binding protein